MKSLSDYTKILRDTATNLNLHGESVEMLVQMLANALYISEVEHITYSQEASLERASLENSKIQHCVNQMYSVYRGANPRVILNFKASKLFQFNPYDEIIKSNNFKVYYLGYFDESKGEIVYSSSTIYPDSSATIIGLLASEIYTSEWTISGNLYYQSHPETNLSGDLYLKDKTNGVDLDVTRLFYDHLRENKFFDLTLPGYGCRIYYPETYRGQDRENLSNLELELNVYKYFSLSDTIESERKALKMNGAVLQDFKSTTLNSLGAKEDYPGLIYIPETSRDGVETIHHKANKSRYTGTYLSTNSDLSFLLQEYYPGKIRTSGVTYRFDTPKSTTVEVVNKTQTLSKNFNGTFLSYSGLKNQLTGWTNTQGYLPAGTLSFKYSKEGVSGNSNLSYDIICSSSILPASVVGDKITPNIESVEVKILKNSGGITELLTTPEAIKKEGLKVLYKYSNDYVRSLSGSLSIPVSNLQRSSNYKLDVYLVKESFNVSKDDLNSTTCIDIETLPAVFLPIPQITTTTENDVTTKTEETSVGSFYGLNLKDDTLYIQTDYDGNFISTNNITEASMYYNGQKITNGECVYSLIPVSDVVAEIDSKTGEIKITGMNKEKNIAYITVTAEYQGNLMTETLTIKKSIVNVSDTDKPVAFYIYGDQVSDKPLLSLIATGDIKSISLDIPENTWKQLIIVKDGSGITLEDGVFQYSYAVINNTITSGETMVPSLYLYYIPYASSNLLSSAEKDRFISTNKAYYITQDISITEGKEYVARFDIKIELFNNSITNDTILDILERYSYKFNQDLGNKDNHTTLYEEIKSLVTKVSDVKYVSEMNVVYLDLNGEEVDYQTQILPNLDISYFDIECNILSVVSSSNN